MDRRFFAWILLTFSLFMLWSSMNQRALLDKKAKEEAAAERTAKKEREAAERQERAAAVAAKEDIPAPPAIAPSRHILGTYRYEDQYRLSVALTSLGAGVERAELVEQTKPGRFRYRSLASRGGYLGYLALTHEAEGVRVGCVPIGSPASLAVREDNVSEIGLRPNDLIVQLNATNVLYDIDVENVLAKLKPKSKVILKVRRSTSENEDKLYTFTTELSEAPLDVVRMQDDLPREEVPGNLLRPSLMTTLAKVDDVEAVRGNETIAGLEETLNSHWQAKPIDVENGMGIEFTLPLPSYLSVAGAKANLELVKRYRLSRAQASIGEQKSASQLGYHLDVEAVVRNLDDVSHSVAVRQEGMNGITLEAWWYAIKLSQSFMSAAGARDVMLARKSGPHELITRRTIQENTRSYPEQPDAPFFGSDFPLEKRSFRYLGVDQQYFTSAIIPHPQSPNALENLSQGATRSIADISKSVSSKDIGTNVSFWFDTTAKKVEPKSELSQRYLVFMGPKEPSLLDAYGLGSSVYYGWPIFEWVAKPLSFILHTFYSLVRNYGIAIVMLTILVRSCMFPLSRRAAIMGQRMQEMQPEMKRINELYKDDMNKRGQEIQLLYKKYNLNPMASCLPVFVQIPIFMGLYRCVSTDIALRHQPLIPGIDWCSNLAGPDMLASFPSWMPDIIAGKGSGWFGPYFNLLPILTIALFIIQQKVLMPKATDEQTRMTQQMMMVMTIVMGVLFFKVPAGLCIYFITSSIWSLVERRLIKKFIPPASASSAELATSPGSPPSPKPKSISTKSPETLADVMDSVKKFWGKGKAQVEADNAATAAARKKHRKKK